MDGLIEHFHRHFELAPAIDSATLRAVHQLRFDVYCEDLGYEDPLAFPDGEEYDTHDPYALHGLLRHRESGMAAGCFRLILNTTLDTRPLPFESACGNRLTDGALHPIHMSRARFGEISRLAVHRRFRCRRDEQGNSLGVVSRTHEAINGRRYPLVATGLFLGAAALVLESGLDCVYVMMEPRLARLLRSCGLIFTQVGAEIDYHGRRAPFMISRAMLLLHIRDDALELVDHFRNTFQHVTRTTAHALV